jgi:hypothetical protein
VEGGEGGERGRRGTEGTTRDPDGGGQVRGEGRGGREEGGEGCREKEGGRRREEGVPYQKQHRGIQTTGHPSWHLSYLRGS